MMSRDQQTERPLELRSDFFTVRCELDAGRPDQIQAGSCEASVLRLKLHRPKPTERDLYGESFEGSSGVVHQDRCS